MVLNRVGYYPLYCFLVYIDDLFVRLQESGFGCKMGDSYAGCLGYADDLSLLAPTKKGLQKMIDICENYANEFDILFNANKSQFLIFKGRGNIHKDCKVRVNGTLVQNIEKATHLGHVLRTNDPESCIHESIAQFWRSFNIFRSDFGHIYSSLQCRLFKQYCCSFYGSPIWSVTSKGFNDICIAWRKALRKIWRVSNRTHCDLVASLSDSIPLEQKLVQIFLRFKSKAFLNGCKLLKSTIQVACLNPNSTYCNNVMETERILAGYNNDGTGAAAVDIHLRCKSQTLRDFIDIRDGVKDCDLFDNDELQHMIDSLCVS